MLTAAERWGGGDDERPFVPRAFSVARIGEQGLEFLLEDVGPGTARLAELGPGDGLWVLGPLGNGFALPDGGRRALLCGGGVGIAPLAILQDALRARRSTAPVMLGFRDADHAGGAELLHEPQVATDDGSVGHAGLVTELLDAALDDDGRRDRLRLRAAGDARVRQGAVRGARSARPAGARERHGVRIRSLFRLRSAACAAAATCASVLDGPVVDAERLDTCLVAGAGH